MLGTTALSANAHLGVPRLGPAAMKPKCLAVIASVGLLVPFFWLLAFKSGPAIVQGWAANVLMLVTWQSSALSMVPGAFDAYGLVAVAAALNMGFYAAIGTFSWLEKSRKAGIFLSVGSFITVEGLLIAWILGFGT